MTPTAEYGFVGTVLALAFGFLLRYIDRRVAQDQVLRGELYGAYNMRIGELEEHLAELKRELAAKEAEIAKNRERIRELEMASRAH